MILFLTQYYSGLGHSMRIKHIAEETAKLTDCCIVNHLFKPPIEIKGIKTEYTLVKSEDYGQTWSDPLAVSPTVYSTYAGAGRG